MKLSKLKIKPKSRISSRSFSSNLTLRTPFAEARPLTPIPLYEWSEDENYLARSFGRLAPRKGFHESERPTLIETASLEKLRSIYRGPRADGAGSDANPISFATWNVFRAGKAGFLTGCIRARGVLEEIIAHKPHIICLQDVHPELSKLIRSGGVARLKGYSMTSIQDYKVATEDELPNQPGLMVLARNYLVGFGSNVRAARFSQPSAHGSGFVIFELCRRGVPKLRIVNVACDPPSRATMFLYKRLRQWEEVMSTLETLPDLPTIISGSFYPILQHDLHRTFPRDRWTNIMQGLGATNGRLYPYIYTDDIYLPSPPNARNLSPTFKSRTKVSPCQDDAILFPADGLKLKNKMLIGQNRILTREEKSGLLGTPPLKSWAGLNGFLYPSPHAGIAMSFSINDSGQEDETPYSASVDGTVGSRDASESHMDERWTDPGQPPLPNVSQESLEKKLRDTFPGLK